MVERQAYHSSWMQMATPGVRTGAEEVSSWQIPSLLGRSGSRRSRSRLKNQEPAVRDSEAGLQTGDQSQVSVAF